MSSSRRLNERLAGRYNHLYGRDEEGGGGTLSNVSSSGSLAGMETGIEDEDYGQQLRIGGGNDVAPPVSVKKIKENIIKREAYFKSDAPATKFDAALRERDGKTEKDKPPMAQVTPQVQQAPALSSYIIASHDAGTGDSVKQRAVAYTPALPLSMSVVDGAAAKELEGYVGFANLPNQVYRKAVKRGFEFTLMVVGESGLGKSTLIDSLFLSELYSADYPGPSQRIKKTVQVETSQVLLKEGGVQLKLTVVDTPGFGDAVDNSNCWQPIMDYVDNKYDEYLNAESKVNRRTMPDNRVHCCLYFIAPCGHGLKPLDIEIMKRLHDKVNVIPLIAKADTMMPDECRDFKKTILNEIAQHKIRIYEFPDVDDDEENKVLRKLKDRVPFAVVGSNKIIEVNDKKVRGRQYPWGVVEVENLEHNDFLGLRDMIIRTHMQDLKDVTNNVHYENFRYSRLASAVSPTTAGEDRLNSATAMGSRDPLSQMEEEKKEHVQKMKKMEAEMELVFETKVKEKAQKLKDSESDLIKRSEQMKKNLEQQQVELSDKRKQFEAEKTAWEEQLKARDGSNGSDSSEVLKSKKKTGLFN